MENTNKNKVLLSGTITSNFEFDYTTRNNINLYNAELAVRRKSDVIDYIPIQVPENLIDINMDYIGKYVSVEGEYISCNIKRGDGKSSLKLIVKVNYIKENNVEYNANMIILDGYICKGPTYRITPLEKEITDLILAVNGNIKSSYIPCIFWYDNAKAVANCDIATHIQLVGRIQSREYIKKLSEIEQEPRVAYEVSVYRMKIV